MMSNQFIDEESSGGARDCTAARAYFGNSGDGGLHLQLHLTCILFVRFGIREQGLQILVSMMCLQASWLLAAARIALLMNHLVELLPCTIKAAMQGAHCLLLLYR